MIPTHPRRALCGLLAALSCAAGTVAAAPASVADAGPVTRLTAAGSLNDRGVPSVSATWSLPAGASGAVACVVAGSDPAPDDCRGLVVGESLPRTPFTTRSGDPVTVTVFAVDGGARGPGTSTTLAPASLRGPVNIITTALRGAVLTMSLSGAPAGEQVLRLASHLPGTLTWTPRSAHTSGTGAFAAPRVRPQTQTFFQWTFAGGPGVLADVATPTLVQVRPVLSRVATPTRVRLRRQVVVWGRAWPVLPGRVVALQRQDRTGWQDVASGRVASQTMPNGRRLTGYRLPVRTTRTGRVAYRVRYAGSATLLPAVSTAVVTSVVR